MTVDLLQHASEAAERSLTEGGVPIGAALIAADGAVLCASSNRVVQDGDFLAHAEVAAIRGAGPLPDYAGTTLVTTLAPCWYCAGLVRFLGIGHVVVGDGQSWSTDAVDWLRAAGTRTSVVNDPECIERFQRWLKDGPESWNEMPVSVDGAPDR